MQIQVTPPFKPTILPDGQIIHTPNNPTMGIKTGNTKTITYAPSCYITKEVGKFKDYKIHITKNFINNKLTSTLYYVTDKAGKWLTSKLKYIEVDVQKIIWSKKNA